MERIKQFFWICSGAHIPLLRKAESESSKYAGIGATIFFTGIFAALAGSYAMFTVFDDPWIAGVLGIVWGLMIFNLDRYIVSSMRKEGNTLHEVKTALPRIVLAVLISIIIAKPPEMKIFEKEIGSELVIMEQQTFALQENEIKVRFQADQEKLKSEMAILKNEINEKTNNRDALYRIAQEEADGTGGSKLRNAGPIYKIKKADADRVSLELDQLSRKNDLLIQQKLKSLSQGDSLVAAEITSLAKQKLDGPASRMEALSRLVKKSDAVWWANLFIMLLFIAIETAPVFVKLISPRGPYDHLLKIEEHGFEGQRVEAITSTNAAIKMRTKELPETEKSFLTKRLDIRLNES
jgi:Domain of unknown function (DUF4407)